MGKKHDPTADILRLAAAAGEHPERTDMTVRGYGRDGMPVIRMTNRLLGGDLFGAELIDSRHLRLMSVRQLLDEPLICAVAEADSKLVYEIVKSRFSSAVKVTETHFDIFDNGVVITTILTAVMRTGIYGSHNGWHRVGNTQTGFFRDGRRPANTEGPFVQA